MSRKVEENCGCIEYFNDNYQLHNEVGFAAIRCSNPNKQYWYINGKIHREDGPAIYDSSRKEEEWYFFNLKHRVKGPAVDYPKLKEWWKDGKRHRLNAPAVIKIGVSSKVNEYWEFGKERKNI